MQYSLWEGVKLSSYISRWIAQGEMEGEAWGAKVVMVVSMTGNLFREVP